MRRRARLVSLLLGASLAVAAGAGSRPTAGDAGYFVVRPDPRLCPSPLCGGYWVALANRARTRCADGLRRPSCYVAKAVDADGRPRPSFPAVGLAHGRLESQPFESFGELGVLVVDDAFAAAGQPQPSGRFVRLVDTGIRCVRAPCFSIRKAGLNSPGRTALSGVDLRPARLGSADTTRAEAALAARPAGLLAQGRVVSETDGGRVFRATRVFLRATQPRA